MNAAEELKQTFWIKTNNDEDFIEVSQEKYVEMERKAGFHNKYGSNDEPATASFSSHSPLGQIRGETRYNHTYNIATNKVAIQESFQEKTNQAVYVVRWMSHEYEAGWGVDDKEEFCRLYKTMEDAQNAVDLKFKNGRNLYGAGDYFVYPSGPDHKYHVYEVPVVPNHEIFNHIENDGLTVYDSISDKKMDTFWKQLVLVMQSDKAIIHTIDFEGLHPKPMTDAGRWTFGGMSAPNWDNALQLTKK